MIFATANIYSQTYTISFAATIAFPALDSVKVENLTHPVMVKWHAGDVLQLVLSNGIKEMDINYQDLHVYPNPMQGQTEISFYAKQAGNARLTINDISGKELLKAENKLLQGIQKYQLAGLKQGIYFINISGEGYFYTSKLISQNSTTSKAKIKYIGNEKPEAVNSNLKSTKTTVTMAYTTGDNLRFTGYAGNLTVIVNDVPNSSKTITFTATAITTVLIPSGTFTMGSPNTEIGRNIDETQHQVTLSEFRLSKYEITNEQYAAFMNANNIDSNGMSTGAFPNEVLILPSSLYNPDWGLNYVGGLWVPAAGYENHPVINVTWYGATEFATYLGGSLPTEAQWEYACRANSTTPFNTGECLTDTQANYNWKAHYSSCVYYFTHPNTTQDVGSYPANAYGLHDMHGNVCEWCSDWYDIYPISAQTNPGGATTGLYRVVRGGDWYWSCLLCRSSCRLEFYPESIGYYLGFRIAFFP